MEGKYQPQEMPPPAYNNKGVKTVGILLWIAESIWNTGIVVVLYSGFCALVNIIVLFMIGKYDSVLIKKRIY